MSGAPGSDLRKGWCPGALRPMMAKDGLLVRLRITCGVLRTASACAIADLAERLGNGLFDLSGRANLQMRGVREATLPALLDGLRVHGLLDADADGEAVRNVLASPLAGLHDGPDIRPIVAALENRLTRERGLHGLPSKFGFLVDDGSAPSLTDVTADLRFVWVANRQCFAVGLGGTRGTATAAGTCRAEDLCDRAAAIGHAVVALTERQEPPLRMRDLLRTLPPSVAGEWLGVQPERSWTGGAPPPTALAGEHRFGSVMTLGLAAPFGRLDAAMLRRAAAVADRACGELRLTPWRTILVPLSRTGWHPSELMLSQAACAGFIVDPTDPRLQVAACTGRESCERATTSTHTDAEALAPLAQALGPGVTLHVSGCPKGCAKPSATAVTLVGRNGRYDLLRHGRPGDSPTLRDLGLADVRSALTAKDRRAEVPA